VSIPFTDRFLGVCYVMRIGGLPTNPKARIVYRVAELWDANSGEIGEAKKRVRSLETCGRFPVSKAAGDAITWNSLR
jgi:hypothetical protein